MIGGVALKVNNISEELDGVRMAVRKASNEWESRFVWGSYSKGDGCGDEEYVEYLIRIAYLSLLAFLDKNNMKQLSRYLVNLWNTKHLHNLLDSYMSEYTDEPLLSVTDTFWEITSAIGNISIEKEAEPIKHGIRIKTILERIPNVAYRLNLDFSRESDLDKIAEAVLVPIFPDINSNPSLTLGESFRHPDSAIPSVNTLLEYKFVASKKDISRVVDEMQADIRNYAQHPWKHLLFVVGQNQPYVNEEKLRLTLVKEPSRFQNIEVVVITHSPRKS